MDMQASHRMEQELVVVVVAPVAPFSYNLESSDLATIRSTRSVAVEVLHLCSVALAEGEV